MGPKNPILIMKAPIWKLFTLNPNPLNPTPQALKPDPEILPKP